MRKAFLVTILLFTCSLIAQDKMKPEELIAKHLDSIGTAEVRAAVKTRTVNGKFVMHPIVGGTGDSMGDAGVLTSGQRMKLLLRSSSERYAGEKVWFDGKRPGVDMANVGTRTYLGDFLYHNDCILRDGLFSGAVGTSWALEDVKARGAKLVYDGLKVVDGKSLLQLTYIPKKSASELEIRLFFDPETYRHVMTQYKIEVVPYMSVRASRNDRQASTQNSSKTRYNIVERFSEFQTADGITLPTKWQIDYSVDPVDPIQMRWTVDWTRISNNPNIDLKAVFPES